MFTINVYSLVIFNMETIGKSMNIHHGMSIYVNLLEGMNTLEITWAAEFIDGDKPQQIEGRLCNNTRNKPSNNHHLSLLYFYPHVILQEIMRVNIPIKSPQHHQKSLGQAAVMAKRPPLMQGTRSLPSSSQLNCSLQSNIIFTWDLDLWWFMGVSHQLGYPDIDGLQSFFATPWTKKLALAVVCLISDDLPKSLTFLTTTIWNSDFHHHSPKHPAAATLQPIVGNLSKSDWKMLDVVVTSFGKRQSEPIFHPIDRTDHRTKMAGVGNGTWLSATCTEWMASDSIPSFRPQRPCCWSSRSHLDPTGSLEWSLEWSHPIFQESGHPIPLGFHTV